MVIAPELPPQWRLPSLQSDAVHFVRPSTLGVKLYWAFLLALASALSIHGLFLTDIHNFSSGVQSDYIIDAYYYLHLGEEALALTQTEQLSIQEAAAQLEPTPRSSHIVLLTSLLLLLLPSPFFAPFVLVPAFFSLAYLLLRTRVVSPVMLLLPFGGLLPYIFVPSKEAFVILGLLMAVTALLDRRYLILGVVGMILIYLARTEAFYLLIASCVLWALAQRRLLLHAVLLLSMAVYVMFARETIFTASSIFQATAQDSEIAFCDVGPFNVCLDSLATAESTYLQRIAALLLFPLKWIVDLGSVFTAELDGPAAIAIRVLNVAHLLVFAAILFAVTPASGRARDIRWILFSFGALYGSVYGALLFFQASRHILLATFVLLLGLSLRTPSVHQQSRLVVAP